MKKEMKKEIASLADVRKEMEKEREPFEREIIIIDDLLPEYRYNSTLKRACEKSRISKYDYLEKVVYETNDADFVSAFRQLQRKIEGKRVYGVLTDLDWTGENWWHDHEVYKEVFFNFFGDKLTEKLENLARNDNNLESIMKAYCSSEYSALYSEEQFLEGVFPSYLSGVLMYEYCREKKIPCVVYTHDTGHAAVKFPYLVKAGVISLDQVKILLGFYVKEVLSLVDDKRLLGMLDELKKKTTLGEFYLDPLVRIGDLIIGDKHEIEGWFFALKNLIGE